MLKIIFISTSIVWSITYWIRSKRNDFMFPNKCETRKVKVKRKIEGNEKEIDIKKTSGVFHKVPFYEIVSGGPRKDGIPSIDNPKFISIEIANKYLFDMEKGIALEIEGRRRFYPFQILAWHQVVNDSINGKRILVSYCPLCFCGAVFSPFIEEQQVEFGSSGRLWNSNSLMYDRKTESLWSQISGEAIYGKMTGERLKKIDFEQIDYGGFKKRYTDGEILSRKTGFFRFYEDEPYEEYYRTHEGTVKFCVSNSQG